MESKHTPGPWRWSDAYADTQGRKTWSLLGAEGYGILSCDGVANSPQGLGDNPNADLIAQAPTLKAQRDELLAALKDLLGYAEHRFGDNDFWKSHGCMVAARAAIARVGGTT